MSTTSPDLNTPLANGLTPQQIYKTYMSGLEQYEVSYQSLIDEVQYLIDDQLKVVNEKTGSYVRLILMKYSSDLKDEYCDIAIELKIGRVYLSAGLSPDFSDLDFIMAAMETVFDNCCSLIGKKRNCDPICATPFPVGPPQISLN